MTNRPIDNLIGINDVAALLGLHADTVRDYHDDKLQPARINGQRIYDRERVLAYAAARAEARAHRAATRADH